MSNMLQDCPFFPVPQVVIDSGLWKRMGNAQRSLYIALLRIAERRRTRCFAVADGVLAESAGVSTRAIRDARIKLWEYKLILYEPNSGRPHVYTLCDPRTNKPFPGHPKSKKKPMEAL